MTMYNEPSVLGESPARRGDVGEANGIADEGTSVSDAVDDRQTSATSTACAARTAATTAVATAFALGGF